ncbi:MAG: alpha-hydroxy-acid oxidizing protein [Rhizobiaceae bacterium]|nr:alpha-hydroxy-acid oxidizing protein [Rhizobiaceae bacterium]
MTDFDPENLEERAREVLNAGAFAFCKCGADDEETAADNERAWRRLKILPRMFADVSKLSCATTILGAPVTSPIMIAPSGRHALFHPQAERATAIGAADEGCIYVMSSASNTRVEDVASATPDSNRWFQLYLSPDRGVSDTLIERACTAGFKAIVLTLDQPYSGRSPRAMASPLGQTTDVFANLPGQPIARSAYDPETSGKPRYPATLADLEQLVIRSPLPIVAKGIMRGDDALRCHDAGASAVIVSNHGGRHLDTAAATCDALAGVVEAAGKKLEIYVDGGIRRGTDVFKALALGARSVLVGRPVLWALATQGAGGVSNLLSFLREDLIRTMALSGAPDLSLIGRDLLAEGHAFRPQEEA